MLCLTHGVEKTSIYKSTWLEYSYNFDNTTYAYGMGYIEMLVTFKNNWNTTSKQENYIAISKNNESTLYAIYCRFIWWRPYFEAFKGQNNTTPAYTDDAVIYKELVKELEG
jgi:hypothetical protein